MKNLLSKITKPLLISALALSLGIQKSNAQKAKTFLGVYLEKAYNYSEGRLH